MGEDFTFSAICSISTFSEMLGRNLNDLRHRMPTRRFSTGTGLRVCAQLLVAVRDIHTVGFLVSIFWYNFPNYHL